MHKYYVEISKSDEEKYTQLVCTNMDFKQISEIFTGGNMQVVLAGTQRVQSSSLVLGDHFWREIRTFYPGKLL